MYSLRALCLFAVCLPLYRYAVPMLESAGLNGAQLVLSSFGASTHVQRTEGAQWRVYDPGCPRSRNCSVSFGGEEFSAAVFSSVLIVGCLLCAAPLPLKQRLLLCAKGTVIVLGIEALSIVGCVLALSRFCLDDTSGRFCRNLAGFLSPWSVAVSIAVWSALTRPFLTGALTSLKNQRTRVGALGKRMTRI